MPTLTVTSDKKAVIDNRILALAGEMGVTLTVVVDATIQSFGTGKLTYIDFIQADGEAYYKGSYDCSSGTFNATLGAVDTILTYAGEVSMQLVIRDALPPTGVEAWKSNKVKVVVEESINATLPASYIVVPPMTNPTTFPAENVTLADAGNRITATNVEDALQEITGSGRTTETIKANADAITAIGDMATWTPIISGITLGAGEYVARSNQIGNLVYFEFRLTFAADTTITDIVSFTLPTAVKYSHYVYGYALDSGTTHFMLTGELASSSCTVRCGNASGDYLSVYQQITDAIPMTWAVNDIIFLSGWYEVA